MPRKAQAIDETQAGTFPTRFPQNCMFVLLGDVVIQSLRYCSERREIEMLKIRINSYDSQFDTYACTFTDSVLETTTESLIPAVMLPYIAPGVCLLCSDLPFDAVGHSFYLQEPSKQTA